MTPGASNTVSEGGQNQTPIRGQYLTPIDKEGFCRSFKIVITIKPEPFITDEEYEQQR